MRILADIPDDDVKWLDRLAERLGESRAALLREAVAAYRRDAATEGISEFFGLWRGRDDIEDGVEFQRRLRRQWVREWDPEYDPDVHGN